jgi:hypothetical protein
MSNNIGGIRFCSECNNMMKPIEGILCSSQMKKY